MECRDNLLSGLFQKPLGSVFGPDLWEKSDELPLVRTKILDFRFHGECVLVYIA